MAFKIWSGLKAKLADMVLSKIYTSDALHASRTIGIDYDRSSAREAYLYIMPRTGREHTVVKSKEGLHDSMCECWKVVRSLTKKTPPPVDPNSTVWRPPASTRREALASLAVLHEAGKLLEKEARREERHRRYIANALQR